MRARPAAAVVEGVANDETSPGQRHPWWRVPLYPVVIPVVVVLLAWASAAIHPAAMYRSLVVAVLISILLTLCLSLACRSRDLGALAATGVLVAIVALSVPMLSLVILLAVGLLLALGLLRRGRPWALAERITRGMGIAAAILLLASVINLAQTGVLIEGAEDIRLDFQGRGAIGSPADGLPDVYLILVDGYPGVDARALAPEYPRSRLRDELLSRGFDMAEDTHTNYLQTTTTLASMFQMRHLQGLSELSPPWGSEPSDARRLRRLINDAPALDLMHGAGYSTTAITSGFGEVELRRVDRIIEPVTPTEFEVSLLRGTGLGHILQAIAPDLVSAAQRDGITRAVDVLASIPASDSDRPRFVFAHIPAPHPPWVFGPDGSPRSDNLFTFYTDSATARQLDRKDALYRHLDQAAYTDGLILEAIDGIVARSTIPPVIVLFSDHGPGTGFDHLNPLESDFSERTSNVLAALTPGHPGLFAEPTTPVAIMPLVLNAYLGTSLQAGEDSVWAWSESKLDFVEINLDD